MTDTTKPVAGRAGEFTPDDGSPKRHGFPALSFQTVEARDEAAEILESLVVDAFALLRDERDAALERVRELEAALRRAAGHMEGPVTSHRPQLHPEHHNVRAYCMCAKLSGTGTDHEQAVNNIEHAESCDWWAVQRALLPKETDDDE